VSGAPRCVTGSAGLPRKNVSRLPLEVRVPLVRLAIQVELLDITLATAAPRVPARLEAPAPPCANHISVQHQALRPKDRSQRAATDRCGERHRFVRLADFLGHAGLRHADRHLPTEVSTQEGGFSPI